MALLPTLAFALMLSGQAAAEQPTAPASSSAAPSAANAPLVGSAEDLRIAAEQPIPPGAPTDDYGFVNWCWGALNGHMALYPRVRDQLSPSDYESDQQMLAAGRAYLQLYEDAVQAADRASPTSRAADAQAGRRAGANVWAGNERATPVQLKWAFVGWSLPGRCEAIARRLLASSELMAPALRTSGNTAVTPPAAATEPASASSEPAAAPTPQ